MTWAEANQQYLIASIALARETFIGTPEGSATASAAIESAARNLPQPATITTLTQIFELSGFERMLLLLAAAAEIDLPPRRCISPLGSHRRNWTTRIGPRSLHPAHSGTGASFEPSWATT